MKKIDGSALIFDEEEVRTTRAHLPRLIRVIFFGLAITNNEYIARYQRHIRTQMGGKTARESNQKLATDRKFLQDKHNITFKLINTVLIAMGLDIEAISVRVRNRLTEEVRTFSTDDTVDSLKRELEKDREIGIKNILGFSDTNENKGADLSGSESGSLYTVVNVVMREGKDPASDIGDPKKTKSEALDSWFEKCVETSDNVDENSEVVRRLRDLPVGKTVVGSTTKNAYVVVEISNAIV